MSVRSVRPARADRPISAAILADVASLAEGVRRLGHTLLIVRGGPACPRRLDEPASSGSKTVSLPWPTPRDVEAALATPGLSPSGQVGPDRA